MAYERYNYSWEYYPPPYDFLSPMCPPGANPAEATAAGWSGGLTSGSLYGAPKTGGCGGHSHDKGMGACCSSCAAGGPCEGKQGLGQLFSSGLDYTQWGIGEWACIAFGAYVLVSVVSDVGNASKSITGTVRKARRRAQRRQRLQQDLEAL